MEIENATQLEENLPKMASKELAEQLTDIANSAGNIGKSSLLASSLVTFTTGFSM